MKKKMKNLAISTAIGAAIVGVSTASALAHLEPKKDDGNEKCYGIVKIGKNDCSSKAGKHGCAGQAKVDAGASEWLSLPQGLCEKLVGSSLSPAEVSAADKSETHEHAEGESH